MRARIGATLEHAHVSAHIGVILEHAHVRARIGATLEHAHVSARIGVTLEHAHQPLLHVSVVRLSLLVHPLLTPWSSTHTGLYSSFDQNLVRKELDGASGDSNCCGPKKPAGRKKPGSDSSSAQPLSLVPLIPFRP